MTGRPSANQRLLGLIHAKGFAQATAEDDLLAVGLTSFQILQLSADIEREFGTAVDLAVVLGAPTIGDLGEHLASSEPDI